MKLVPQAYVGRPGFTSLQNQARFYYVIRKFGISKADLGVVSHGLRHQYANDHFRSGRRGPVTGAWWDFSPSRQQACQEARLQGARPQPRTRQHGLLGSDAGLPEAANDPAA
jgi:hypothetical protein